MLAVVMYHYWLSIVGRSVFYLRIAASRFD